MGGEKETMTDKFPKWLTEYRRVAVEALGLQAWDITWVLEDQIDPEDRDTVGRAETLVEYLQATIRLERDYHRKPTVEAKINVLHELLHLALARYARAAASALEEHLKPRHVRAAKGRISGEQEEAIVRLSRALYPLVELRMASAQAAGVTKKGKQK